jgi:hypothetical protein
VKNQDATAEIVGTVLLIIILIFFFGNVFLWSNEVNKNAEQIKWNKLNSPVTLDAVYTFGGGSPSFSHLEVTNKGGVGTYLSRLWILDHEVNIHMYADLEVWMPGGISKKIYLDTITFTTLDGEPVVDYEPPIEVTFKIFTNTGNNAADTYYQLTEIPWVDLGLFYSWQEPNSEFLNRLNEGKFDVVLPNIGNWIDNTLNLIPASDINEFISSVKNVNPNIKVFAWFGTYPRELNNPDLTTPALRQQCIDEVVRLVNYANWDGILDNTEDWIGSETDQFEYFSDCASAVESMGVAYYPWMFPSNMPLVDSQRDAIGAYGADPWNEDQWKAWLDDAQEYANVGFSWYMMVKPSSSPTLWEQLQFLDYKIAQRGANYYSKMDVLGIYYYQAMENEDWDAWISWINQTPSPTPTPTPIPPPTPTPPP